MFSRYIRPSPVLAPYVKHYWVMEIDACEGEVWERVVPTGNVELMVHYKRPFVEKRTNALIAQPRSLVSGLAGGFSDVAARGESGVIAVTFYPWGACNFFGFPLREIEDAGIDLRAIDSNSGRRLEELVGDARTVRERVAAIEQFLLARMRPIEADEMRLLRQCIANINRSEGRISASGLCGIISISGRSLERKFSLSIGKTPKQFIKIIRFRNVVRSLCEAGEKTLSGVAYDNGYFDQAHFINDFKAMAGCTPKEFLAMGPCGTEYSDLVY